MDGRNSLKLRMTADVIMAFGFGIVAPIALAPSSRNWQTMLMTFAVFTVTAGFWYDLMRTIRQFRKLPSN
ncbi:MAG: hypothetical protein WAL45_14850 [Terracidiphilus sp.]